MISELYQDLSSISHVRRNCIRWVDNTVRAIERDGLDTGQGKEVISVDTKVGGLSRRVAKLQRPRAEVSKPVKPTLRAMLVNHVNAFNCH